MKKLFTALFVTILLFSTLVFTGCNNIKATDENSYNISIYKELYEQKENGEVVFNGLELKKAFQVVRSQLFELDYEKIEIINYDGTTTTVLGKYAYTGVPSNNEVINDKKIQAFPTKDTTIIMREREKKNINIYYQGQEVGSMLNVEDRVYYNNNFKNTYNESFYIYGSEIKEVLQDVRSDVTIELYTNSSFTGEPFATGDFDYYYYNETFTGSISFTLIKSTNVYVKVIS